MEALNAFETETEDFIYLHNKSVMLSIEYYVKRQANNTSASKYKNDSLNQI